MFKLKTAAIAVSIAFLSGCATQQPPRSIVGDFLDFGSYTNENTKRTGIAQVFEMDGKTVIQMAGADYTKPRIVDEEGNDVSYTTTGTYIVLDRTPPKFKVSQGAETAVIARALGLPIPGAKPATPATSSPTPKRPLSTSMNSLPGNDMARLANDIDARDRYMKAIESLQAQLNDLRAALASLGPATQSEVRKVAVKKSLENRGKGKTSAVANTMTNTVTVTAVKETPAQKHARENAIAKARVDQLRGQGSINDM